MMGTATVGTATTTIRTAPTCQERKNKFLTQQQQDQLIKFLTQQQQDQLLSRHTNLKTARHAMVMNCEDNLHKPEAQQEEHLKIQHVQAPSCQQFAHLACGQRARHLAREHRWTSIPRHQQPVA